MDAVVWQNAQALQGGKINTKILNLTVWQMLGVTLQWTTQCFIQRGVEIFLIASGYRNQDVCWPEEPLGLYADFTLPAY